MSHQLFFYIQHHWFIPYNCEITIPFVKPVYFYYSKGPTGPPGLTGAPGLSCEEESDYLTGILLVKHSQSATVPECYGGHTKLWDGYSLLYIEGNEKAHNQDLGMLFLYYFNENFNFQANFELFQTSKCNCSIILNLQNKYFKVNIMILHKILLFS